MHDSNNSPIAKSPSNEEPANVENGERDQRLVSRRESLAAIAGGLGTLAFGLTACSNADRDPLDGISGEGDECSSTGDLVGGADRPDLSFQAQGDICVLTPEQEEGPYFVKMAHVRKNIVDGKAGLPLKLRITLLDPKESCAPIENAAIDVWTCDGLGKYSTANDGMFLRGVQLTDAKGTMELETIFPGWYPGRTNHIHVKVHVGGQVSGEQYTGGHVSHTGNLFFPEQVAQQVAKLAPYRSNTARRTPLTSDMVYRNQKGSTVMMTVEPIDTSDPNQGYVASIVLGVDAASTPRPIGIRS